MAFLFLMATATLSSAAPVPTLAGLRGFGSAIYNDATLQWHGKLPGTLFAANETTVLERTLAAPYTGAGQAATMTMLWMLCGKDNMGRFVSDNVIFRYYVDGEANASLTFKASAAAGSWVSLENLRYYMTSYNASDGGPGKMCPGRVKNDHDDPLLQWPYCGLDLADSDTNDGTFQPWMTKWAGKNGPEGSWLNKYRVPFFKSIRITAQLDWAAMRQIGTIPMPCETCPGGVYPMYPYTLENCSSTMMATFRGLEGDEVALGKSVRLGGVPLPPLKTWNVRFRMNSLRDYVAAPLEFVPLVNISDDARISGGSLFQTTVNFRPGKKAANGGSIEGCWWSSQGEISKHEPSLNLLGTGCEDFFNDAFGFGFFSKIFHNDNSGLTHVHNTLGRGCPECEGRGRPSWFSAYRYFDQDPLPWTGSTFRFVWRNGAMTLPNREKCTLDPAAVSNHPIEQVIDAYSWYYVWKDPSANVPPAKKHKTDDVGVGVSTTISNKLPRLTTDGQVVDSHSPMVAKMGNTYYLYGERYGPGHWSSTGAHRPRLGVYTSKDLVHWTDGGWLHNNTAVPWTSSPLWPGGKADTGQMWCPWAVYSKKRKKVILWWLSNHAGPEPSFASSWGVAESSDGVHFDLISVNETGGYMHETPGGTTAVDGNAILIDDDGQGYIAYSVISPNISKSPHGKPANHMVNIMKLSADYTSTMKQSAIANLFPDTFMEGVMIFKRKCRYYIVASSCCCTCRQGSGAVIYSAASIAGPWVRQARDTNCQADAPICMGGTLSAGNPERPKNQNTVKAQGLGLSVIPTAGGNEYIWHGERWLSGPHNPKGCPSLCDPISKAPCVQSKDYNKGHDFTYWIPLKFDKNGIVQQFEPFVDSFELQLV